MNNNFFSILISIVNKVLDWLKNVLVRFKKAGFGFIDDFLILAWGIGLINEELANYKTEFENSLKSKIILSFS